MGHMQVLTAWDFGGKAGREPMVRHFLPSIKTWWENYNQTYDRATNARC